MFKNKKCDMIYPISNKVFYAIQYFECLRYLFSKMRLWKLCSEEIFYKNT